MLTVHVSANATLPADCTLSFSLNSYATQGPDWSSTGTQALLDHQTITLNAAHPSGTLTVAKPQCFGQTDFYMGTTAFDGTDGPLPSYPDNVVPQPLLAWSNGPSTKTKGCKDSNSLSGPTDPSAPGDPTAPDPSASPDPSPSPVDTASPAPTDTSTPVPTDTPAPTDTSSPTPAGG